MSSVAILEMVRNQAIDKFSLVICVGKKIDARQRKKKKINAEASRSENLNLKKKRQSKNKNQIFIITWIRSRAGKAKIKPIKKKISQYTPPAKKKEQASMKL
ncbi:hypothetical protein BpHYR1_030065 [Brachionus plicatilis]|uniref:Uncharacterized protein n=1 Tax=Brachionus plicatilis TaxID=10195 RepID=A0A3M7SYP6_BRAPC|nr:hypothetical protein BpHYR1_030065 [Brachionus plicatilis]